MGEMSVCHSELPKPASAGQLPPGHSRAGRALSPHSHWAIYGCRIIPNISYPEACAFYLLEALDYLAMLAKPNIPSKLSWSPPP